MRFSVWTLLYHNSLLVFLEPSFFYYPSFPYFIYLPFTVHACFKMSSIQILINYNSLQNIPYDFMKHKQGKETLYSAVHLNGIMQIKDNNNFSQFLGHIEENDDFICISFNGSYFLVWNFLVVLRFLFLLI